VQEGGVREGGGKSRCMHGKIFDATLETSSMLPLSLSPT
jgi:hypothetical protein